MVVKSDAFFYLKSIINTNVNRRSIIINRDCSLFVIISPPFLKKKGKAPDIFQMYPNIL